MEKVLKLRYVLLVSLTLFDYVLLLLAALSIESYQQFYQVAAISIVHLIILICITIVYKIRCGFRCEYTKSGIDFCWYGRCYKKIEYSIVKCITIVGADYGAGGRLPVLDENKKRKAIVSLYSTITYGRNLRPHAGVCIYEREEKKICRSVLRKVDITLLLGATAVDLYITEDMFWLYKNELWDVFTEYGNRVIVSCRYDNYNGYKHIPFCELPKYFEPAVLYRK